MQRVTFPPEMPLVASNSAIKFVSDAERTIRTKVPGGKNTDFTLGIHGTWRQASPEVMLDVKMILHKWDMVISDSGNPQRYHSFQL